MARSNRRRTIDQVRLQYAEWSHKKPRKQRRRTAGNDLNVFLFSSRVISTLKTIKVWRDETYSPSFLSIPPSLQLLRETCNLHVNFNRFLFSIPALLHSLPRYFHDAQGFSFYLLLLLFCCCRSIHKAEKENREEEIAFFLSYGNLMASLMVLVIYDPWKGTLATVNINGEREEERKRDSSRNGEKRLRE